MKKSTAHLFVFLLFSPLSMVSSYFASNFLFDRQEEVAKDYIWQEMNSNESGYVTSFLRSEKTISEIDMKKNHTIRRLMFIATIRELGEI